MALSLGRPRFIHLDDCSTELPTNCNVPEELSDIKPRPPRPDEPPPSFTTILFLHQIALKIHEVLSIRSKKSYEKDYNKVLRVQHEIEAAVASLPAALRANNPDTRWDRQHLDLPRRRQVILSNMYCFLMRLHKPYINTNTGSRAAVIEAALGTLDSQQTLFEYLSSTPNQYRIYGFSFYTIDAALLLSAITIERFPTSFELVERIDLALRQAIYRLQMWSGVSAVAASGKELITQCYAKIALTSATSSQDINRSNGMDGQVPLSAHQEQPGVEKSQHLDYFNDYNFAVPEDFDLDALPRLFESGYFKPSIIEP